MPAHITFIAITTAIVLGLIIPALLERARRQACRARLNDAKAERRRRNLEHRLSTYRSVRR